MTIDTEVTRVAETRKGKYQVAATVGEATVIIDEPKSVGGEGAGPNPYGLLSAALGACTSMTIRMYADRKGWKLAHVDVAVRHSRAGLEARDRFELDIGLDGELDDTQRARLMQIAERCPVHLTLARGSDVAASLVARAALPQTEAGSGHIACMEQACADD